MYQKNSDKKNNFKTAKPSQKLLLWKIRKKSKFHQKLSFFFVLVSICAFIPAPALAGTAPIIPMDSMESSFPATVLQSTQTSRSDFSAYVKTELVKSYSEYQLDKIRTSPRPIKLKSLLKKAQMEFLSPLPENSIGIFKKMVHHLHSFDWNEKERKVLFYALLRLAQLEKDMQNQKILLQEAAVFSMNLELDWEIFPPPLVTNYLSIKKALSFSEVSLNKVFPFHDSILINGKHYSNKQKAKLAFGVYRVTALSSAYESFSQKLSLPQLASSKVKTKALVKGSCQKPSISQQLPVMPIRILFPDFCVWDSTNKAPSLVQNPLPPLPAETTTSILQKQKKQDSQWQTQEWVLLLAVVAGVTGFYFLTDSKKDKTQKKKDSPKSAPIVTIGF